MKNAIGMRVVKAEGEYNLGASKFFGTPTVPVTWEGDFYDDEIFLCQIRLSDIAELAVDDFNTVVPKYERFNEEYLIEFYQVDENEDRTRLFGNPSGVELRRGNAEIVYAV